MIKPEEQKLLQELDKTPFGRAIRSFLEDETANLKDVTQAKNWEDVLGRQHALKIVEHLFSFMKGKSIVDRPKNLYE